MEQYRLNPRKTDEAAARVAAALERGAVIAPVLDGWCVLSLDPGWLVRRFGRAFRLVSDAGTLKESFPSAWRTADGGQRVIRALALPVAGVFLDPDVGPWPGIVVVGDGLAGQVVGRVGRQVGIGVPDENPDPEELSRELGKDAVLTVASDTSPGPGPTVMDFRTRPAVVDRRGRVGILELERGLGETVRLGPDLVFSVLVVCTGNCCRSPMAAGILSKMLGALRVFVYSAGTDAPVGSPATGAAVEAAAELGVDLGLHRSQQLDAGLVRNADLVLVMEEYHRRRVLELVPEAEPKTRLVAEHDIADPIGRPLEVYRKTAVELQRYLDPVAREIRGRLEAEAEG